MRTGNHTTARQYLYLVINPTPALIFAGLIWWMGMPWQFNAIVSSFFILTKIGITGNMKARIRDIEGTSPGIDIIVGKARIWGAYYIEQWIHRWLAFLNCPWFGSGKTEWFIGLWGLLGVIVYVIIQWI